ncbi:hypothetical protein [Roseicella frigidaeris]|uniref:Uncharacterized protein n=1 Tax=Roseicella frigidaeris TaxID=2230885 RepID=A0A327M6A3_9PROT|nr:hypothetical protein [Roseicella frigidaeris]RAI58259.1 hypothetical protein DOO78_14680 [Roseicella frigidaeris]
MPTMPLAQAAGTADAAEASLLAEAVDGLGPGWRLLARRPASAGRPLWAAGQGPAILANAALGLVLLDIAPRASIGAAEQLRAALAAAEFGRRFPGHLPIVHRMLPREHIGRLPDILDYALSWEPPLTLPAEEAWVEAVEQVIAGPLPVEPSPAPPAPDPAAAEPVAMPPAEDPVAAPPAAQAPPSYATPLLIGWTLMLAIGAAVATWQSAPRPAPAPEAAAQAPAASRPAATRPRPISASQAPARQDEALRPAVWRAAPDRPAP